MQRISHWSLRCLMHSRAAASGAFASGSPHWNPPALQRRDYPFNLAAPDLADQVLGGLCRRVVQQMKFYVTNEGIDKTETKWINGVHDSEITATHDDRLPDGIVHGSEITATDDRVYPGKIWEESTHRDGAIYKKDWGFYGRGRPFDLADRKETDLESYMSSKLSTCDDPYPGGCTRHPSDEMIQVCSLRLAKTPLDSESIRLYGYLAARDFLDGRLNYVFNRSRDNPLTVKKGELIEMTGPTRGIVIFADVLMEFDMRIKSGEKEEDDLQLIDGVECFINRECGYVFSYTHRYSGCHGGAVDICFAHIQNGMEAVIEVDAPEVKSAFNLSLVSALEEEYGEIELFHGAELGTKRFVIAVPDRTMMYLMFKVVKEGSEGDLVHYCRFDTTRHGCVSRQIVLEMVCILVKVSILSPDPYPHP